MSTGREIRLIETDEGWTAVEEETGITAVGETRSEALDALDERLATDAGGLGDSLAALAADADVDSVAAVRELREDV